METTNMIHKQKKIRCHDYTRCHYDKHYKIFLETTDEYYKIFWETLKKKHYQKRM